MSSDNSLPAAKSIDIRKVAGSDHCRVALSNRNGRLSPSNKHDSRPTFNSTSVYVNSVLAHDRKAFGSASRKKASEHLAPTYKDFGLQGWREYAAQKFSGHEKFVKSPHGKNIIVAETLREYQREMRSLLDWADEVEIAAEKVEKEFRAEQEHRIAAETRVLELEAELRKANARIATSPTSPKVSFLTSGDHQQQQQQQQQRQSAADDGARRASVLNGGLNKAPASGELSPWIKQRLLRKSMTRATESGDDGEQHKSIFSPDWLASQPLETLEEGLEGTPTTGRPPSSISSEVIAVANSSSTPSTATKKRNSIMTSVVGMFKRGDKNKAVVSSPPPSAPVPPPIQMHTQAQLHYSNQTHGLSPSARSGRSSDGHEEADSEAGELDALEAKISAALAFH